MAWLLSVAAILVAIAIAIAWRDEKRKDFVRFLISFASAMAGLGFALTVDRWKFETRERADVSAVLTDAFIAAGMHEAGARGYLESGAAEREGCAWARMLSLERTVEITSRQWDTALTSKYTSGKLRKALRVGFTDFSMLGEELDKGCAGQAHFLSRSLDVYQAAAARLTFKLGLAVASLDPAHPLAGSKVFKCLEDMEAAGFIAQTSTREIVVRSACCIEWMRANAVAVENWAGTDDPAFFEKLGIPHARSIQEIWEFCRNCAAPTVGADDHGRTQ